MLYSDMYSLHSLFCFPSGSRSTLFLTFLCVNSCPVLFPSYVQLTRSRLLRLSVGITSSIYKLESDSITYVPLPHCLRYSVLYLLEVLPWSWQKIHGKNNTSCLYFLVEVFIKAMKVSEASLRKAVLFHEFISAVNSTNYSSYRVTRQPSTMS